MQGQTSSESRLQRVAWRFAIICAYLFVAAGIAIVCMNLWVSRTHETPTIEIVLETLFYICWLWAGVSVLQVWRSLRKLSPSQRTSAFSGGRPSDPDELFAWKWGWQFAYAVIATLAAMAALPFVDSLIRK